MPCPDCSSHAVAFTKPVLRADAATDLGEGVGGLTDFHRPLPAPFGGQAQPIGNVVVQGQWSLAIGHAALAAPSRLLCRFLSRVFPIDLVEVLRPQRAGRFSGISFVTVTNFSIFCVATAAPPGRVSVAAFYSCFPEKKSQQELPNLPNSDAERLCARSLGRKWVNHTAIYGAEPEKGNQGNCSDDDSHQPKIA